jgi:hypothetical protein
MDGSTSRKLGALQLQKTSMADTDIDDHAFANRRA